jgi:threonine dehydrogenase-like Zn-dependent dehydrogenase
MPPEGFEFLVLGHESLGEVVETGSGVTRFKPGDLAIPMVRRPCNHPDCVACRAGRQDFCYTGDFRERGIKQMHGFMTDFVVDQERYYRHHAVVLGAGPVGLLGMMALVTAGFETWIYSRELTPNPRADIAVSVGARYLSSQTASIAQLTAAVGNIDVVYEAAGASQIAFELLQALGADGVFCFTGVPRHGEPISIDADLLMRNLVLKNQVFFGTVNAGQDAFQAAIRDLGVFYQRWPDAVRSLITRRYPIEEFQEPIFEKSGIKNIIALDGKI